MIVQNILGKLYDTWAQSVGFSSQDARPIQDQDVKVST